MKNENLLIQKEIVINLFEKYKILYEYNEKIFWKRENILQNNSVRVFTEEIRNIQNKYNILNNKMLYLYLFIPYLSKENNLLVDEDGKLMNQQNLAERLMIDRKTISRNVKVLEENKCLIKIKNNKQYNFIINPYLMVGSSSICKGVFKMFKAIGYKENSISFSQIFEEDSIDNLIALDGTKCDSKIECKIHNYILLLSDNIKIEIIKSERYSDFIDNKLLNEISGTMKNDWSLIFNNKKYIIEYFGLMNDTEYVKRHNKKTEIIKLDGKEEYFIPIYENDLYELDKKFDFINIEIDKII